MDILWAAIAAALCCFVARYRRGAWIVRLAVLSHWLLDMVSLRPDMPLVPGSAVRFGLGFWTSVPGTLIVEGGMFIAAVWLYAAGTRSWDRIGSVGLWAYVGAALTDLGGFAFVAWASCVDRHRRWRGAAKPVTCEA